MSARMQSRLRGGVASLASLGVILAGMTIMNDRVRDQVHALVAGRGPSPEVSSSAHQVESAAWLAMDLLRDQSIAHAPLTIFALAATVLLLVMLRT
jgi:hypothetical protein